MINSTANHLVNACEEILLQSKNYNIANEILPSEIKVIDRMLQRGDELQDFYEELNANLQGSTLEIELLLDLVVRVASFWSPEKLKEARSEREMIREKNREIAKTAKVLSKLLKEKENLGNYSSFHSESHYHVLGPIQSAASDNSLFKDYVNDKLDALMFQFDLKYWPSLPEMISEIASDAEKAEVFASDSLTDVGTLGRRPSKADTVKAFFAAMEELKEDDPRFPREFGLSDKSIASIINVALDIDPDNLCTNEYVKRFRQRMRETEESFEPF